MSDEELKAIAKDVEILKPDVSLKRKMGGQDAGELINPTRVKNANRVVSQEKDGLANKLTADLDKLDHLLAACPDLPPDDQESTLQIMMDIALNVKSGAAIVDYVLATEFAKSLYELCRMIKQLRAQDEAIIHAHVNAIRHIFSHDNKSEGSQTERELLEKLKHYTEKRALLA